MDIKSCQFYITVKNQVELTTPIKYVVPTTPAASLTDVAPVSRFFATSDSVNCPLKYELMRTKTSMLSLSTSNVLMADLNVLAKEEVYIRVTSGILNAFDNQYGPITIETQCTGAYEITESSFVTP
jgi:hypothetical protein